MKLIFHTQGGSTKASLVRSLLESNVIGEESVKGIAGTAFSGLSTLVLPGLNNPVFPPQLEQTQYVPSAPV
jgi:hypothetical protein